MKENKDLLTEITFVNGNYQEHSQSTEGYMLRGFFLKDMNAYQNLRTTTHC